MIDYYRSRSIFIQTVLSKRMWFSYYVCILLILLNQANAYAVKLRGVASVLFEAEKALRVEYSHNQLVLSSVHLKQSVGLHHHLEYPNQNLTLKAEDSFKLDRVLIRIRAADVRGRSRKQYNHMNFCNPVLNPVSGTA